MSSSLEEENQTIACCNCLHCILHLLASACIAYCIFSVEAPYLHAIQSLILHVYVNELEISHSCCEQCEGRNLTMLDGLLVLVDDKAGLHFTHKACDPGSIAICLGCMYVLACTCIYSHDVELEVECASLVNVRRNHVACRGAHTQLPVCCWSQNHASVSQTLTPKMPMKRCLAALHPIK